MKLQRRLKPSEEMQKVIIDTNVIVSSLIQKNYPHLIVHELLIEEKFDLCVSEELIAEYYEVLGRHKFKKYQDFYIRAEALPPDIQRYSTKHFPTVKIEIISDKDENKILELADKCEADFIITGNTNDFTFSIYKHTKIVTPKEYWEKYRPE